VRVRACVWGACCLGLDYSPVRGLIHGGGVCVCVCVCVCACVGRGGGLSIEEVCVCVCVCGVWGVCVCERDDTSVWRCTQPGGSGYVYVCVCVCVCVWYVCVVCVRVFDVVRRWW